MQEYWFYPVSNNMDFPENSPMNKLRDGMEDSWAAISENENSRTHALIKSLIDRVCSGEGA